MGTAVAFPRAANTSRGGVAMQSIAESEGVDMSRKSAVAWLALAIALGSGDAAASTLEEQYIAQPGWCPGLAGATIQDEHMNWHAIAPGFAVAVRGKEFVEFHREFLAHSDDYRLYGLDTPVGDVDPDPAIVPVLALPGSLLRFAHTSLNGFARPASHA